LRFLRYYFLFSISGESEQLTNENVPAEPQVEPGSDSFVYFVFSPAGQEPEHEPQSEPETGSPRFFSTTFILSNIVGPEISQQRLHQGWGQQRADSNPQQQRQELQQNEQQRRGMSFAHCISVVC
jgi:hypothetical protein